MVLWNQQTPTSRLLAEDLFSQQAGCPASACRTLRARVFRRPRLNRGARLRLIICGLSRRMAKKLIIAEKPSVAADIARALGGFTRKGDYFESDDYVLSSAVGHLLELALPEEHDVKRGKWSFKHLPVIPPHFDLAPIEKSEQRLNVLLRLMKRKDVTGLVNACDAGREGELIFRYIVQHARDKKPIERLWLQSMTQQSIRDGFADLRADKEMLPLADAAKSPLGGRLAGRHQRHARDDRVQLQGRRLLPDHGRPRADADARDPGRARGEDPRVHAARLLGSARALRRQGGRVSRAAGSIPKFKKDDDAERKAERLWSAKRGRSDRRRLPRQDRHRQRGDQAVDAALAAALRPDQPAARGERPLRLSGAHDAVARAGALREAQGAHLSAHRLARAARGLSRHGEEDPGGARRDARVRAVRQADPQAGLGEAEQAHLRQHARSPTTSRSSRRCRRRSS